MESLANAIVAADESLTFSLSEGGQALTGKKFKEAVTLFADA